MEPAGHVRTSAGAQMFANFESLVGEWTGVVEWSGARSGKGSINATYSLTANGSAVIESFRSDDASPSMTSVYHMDGDDLRVTHYCGMQNQPRLKAVHIDNATAFVAFDLVDITNLRSPTAGHVSALEVRFLDPDHVVVTFRFEEGLL